MAKCDPWNAFRSHIISHEKCVIRAAKSKNRDSNYKLNPAVAGDGEATE
jgi:hypothetical protein